MALKQARHVFLPVTMLQTVAEANKLIKLASESNVILNVYKSGILPADFRNRFDFNGNIWLMELHHFAKVTEGNPGKNLFMNLLHDLDFILGLTRSNVVSIKAAGLSMISSVVDIINARIDFDNGCTATLTCNCASVNDEHTGTVVLKDKIIYIDFIREDASIWNFNRSDRINEPITTHKVSFHHDNDIGEELLSFFTLLNDKNRLLVNSEDGFRPFILATKIMDKVNKTAARSV
jgi:predicted dehydrogenase